jgi:hypothetical protein
MPPRSEFSNCPSFALGVSDGFSLSREAPDTLAVMRFVALFPSFVFAGIVAVFMPMPLAWELLGRPNESYPEP